MQTNRIRHLAVGDGGGGGKWRSQRRRNGDSPECMRCRRGGARSAARVRLRSRKGSARCDSSVSGTGRGHDFGYVFRGTPRRSVPAGCRPKFGGALRRRPIRHQFITAERGSRGRLTQPPDSIRSELSVPIRTSQPWAPQAPGPTSCHGMEQAHGNRLFPRRECGQAVWDLLDDFLPQSLAEPSACATALEHLALLLRSGGGGGAVAVGGGGGGGGDHDDGGGDDDDDAGGNVATMAVTMPGRWRGDHSAVDGVVACVGAPPARPAPH
eukprot:gene17669-biopygen6818